MRPVTAFLFAISCFGAVAGSEASAAPGDLGFPAGAGSTCGDGVIDLTEDCDDGNAAGTDGCVNCHFAVCGDEAVQGSSEPVQVVKDSSFENGSPNEFWEEASTNFGTPLCDFNCGEDVATTGDWYAWFGGVPAEEIGSLTQAITLPADAVSATLSFQIAPFCSGVAADFFRVSAGGSVLLEFGMDGATHPAGPCDPADFYLQELDLTDFLGQTFDLELFASTGSTGQLSNIFVDDVHIDVVMRTEQCDDGNRVSGDGCEADCSLPGGACTPPDVDANGSADVLWRHETTGLVGAWLLDHTSVVSWCDIGTEPSADWQVQGAGDFNLDGETDVLWRHAPSGDVGAWTLGGSCDITGWLPIGTEPSADWHIVSAADLDGDGRSDVVWWNQTSGLVGAWLTSSTGIGSWCSILTEPPASGWRIQGTGDFNADGSPDLLWRNTTSGSVGTLSLDGCALGSFTYLPTEPTNTGWQIQAVSDFTGDCGADVLWRNTTTGDIGLWVMNGNTLDHWVYLAQEPTNSGWAIQGPR